MFSGHRQGLGLQWGGVLCTVLTAYCPRTTRIMPCNWKHDMWHTRSKGQKRIFISIVFEHKLMVLLVLARRSISIAGDPWHWPGEPLAPYSGHILTEYNVTSTISRLSRLALILSYGLHMRFEDNRNMVMREMVSLTREMLTQGSLLIALCFTSRVQSDHWLL